MNLNDQNTRTILGIILIAIAFFFGGDKNPFNPDPVDPKLPKPSDDIVAVVEELTDISDKVDRNKVAATFWVMGEGLAGLDKINSPIQLQYYNDFMGKNTLGKELLDANGNKKYPGLSSSIAGMVSKFAGPQDGKVIANKAKVVELYKGIAWKLYAKEHEDVYDSYEAKAKASLNKYKNEDDEDDDPMVETDPCGGKGYIIHGDGHRTPCPWIADPTKKCATETGDIPLEKIKALIEKSVKTSFQEFFMENEGVFSSSYECNCECNHNVTENLVVKKKDLFVTPVYEYNSCDQYGSSRTVRFPMLRRIFRGR